MVQEFHKKVPKPINTNGRYREKGHWKLKPNTKSISEFTKKVYNTQRPRVMELVRDPQEDTDTVTNASEIGKLFPQRGNVDTSILDLVINTQAAVSEVNIELFTIIEVKTRMEQCWKSAPAPDSLSPSYNDCKNFYSSLEGVEHTSNVVLSMGKIPMEWEQSRIKLIPKKQNQTRINHFRPISLQQLIYKLFSGLLAAHLPEWVEENDRIGDAQKGFREMEGCLCYLWN